MEFLFTGETFWKVFGQEIAEGVRVLAGKGLRLACLDGTFERRSLTPDQLILTARHYALFVAGKDQAVMKLPATLLSPGHDPGGADPVWLEWQAPPWTPVREGDEGVQSGVCGHQLGRPRLGQCLWFADRGSPLRNV
ncbi:MAG: hypothetical protein WCP58_11180 [bacterium]